MTSITAKKSPIARKENEWCD